ncbi:hypothetical protein [Streptomyces sp. KL116D]|uniref:hypothetical protein n=1 Tax=Streptomyces sp. KL116D TaxID=3045152 RepID=UPI0035569DB1
MQASTCSPLTRTQADPLDLVRAARAATAGGSSWRAASGQPQIAALAAAGADAFTIGSALFDGRASTRRPRR